jgi:hypothetical protein
MPFSPRRLAVALVLSCCALGAVACGGDDDSSEEQPAATKPAGDLESMKTFLIDHTDRLEQDAAEIRAAAEDYHARAEAVDFDYVRLLESDREGVQSFIAESFSLKTPAGKTWKQPGNFNHLIETSVYGTEPKWAAKGVEPDLDGDGTVEFGEAMPDADFYVTAARDFEKTAKELGAAAREWHPRRRTRSRRSSS